MTEREKISKLLDIAVPLYELVELNNNFTHEVPMRGFLSETSKSVDFKRANAILEEHFIIQRLGSSIYNRLNELYELLSEFDM
ncbi:hypothetical protein OIT44_06790 [Weissella ceti]|uniref:Uncharacterized protein n=1 Tax=Weissella ceti TaxID=759620 RepID=A0ABT3E5V2_9LACO|nr:hypothetical protein [Weissella ceti]MCW0953755.1 hypothetical protein [Weissella ceti]QVK11412.1 hypothetical protein KHQ31_04105 [Weissella ceti]